jgi:tetratricopeptide (TPR) repeat protein
MSAGRTRAGESWWWLLAAGLPALLYLPTLRYGFVFDDVPLIAKNAALDDLSRVASFFTRDIDAVWRGADSPQSSYYRPLFLVLAALFKSAAGTSPVAWHAAAVGLFALVGILAAVLLRSYGLSPFQAFGAAALFAVHPAVVDSVAWVSGLQDQLLAALGLGAAIAWRRYTTGGGGVGLAALGAAYAAALLSKEAAIGLLLFAALDGAFGARHGEIPVRRLAAGLGLLAVETALYLLVRVAVLGTLAYPFPTAPGLLGTLASLPVVVLEYTRIALFPVGLALLSPVRPVADPFSIRVLVCALGVAFLTAAALVAAKRRPSLLRPAAWSLAWLAPALNLWAVNPEWLVMNRYLFLPVLGLAWAIADVGSAIARPRLAAGAGALLAAIWAGLSLQAMPVFRDERTFWARMIEADPSSATAWAERGRILIEDGDPKGARSAFERARRLDPAHLLVRLRLALLDLAEGRTGEAAEALRELTRVNPGYIPAWRNLPVALARAGDGEAALAAAGEAVRRFPGAADLQVNHAILLASRGRLAEALGAIRRARALAPRDAETALREAQLLEALARKQEARTDR